MQQLHHLQNYKLLSTLHGSSPQGIIAPPDPSRGAPGHPSSHEAGIREPNTWGFYF